MASLISTSNSRSYCDYISACWDIVTAQLGRDSNLGSPVAGSVQNELVSLLALVTGTLNNYTQINDMGAGVNTCLANCTADYYAKQVLAQAVNALDGHCGTRGATVAASIVDLVSYQSYYNGGSGGAAYNSMFTPSFAACYNVITKKTIPPAGVLSPILDAVIGGYTNAMGAKTTAQTGSTYTAGQSVNTTLYSPVSLIAEVTTTFASGTGAPVITVAGTDDQASTSTTWSVTLDSNNPASANSTTITGAVNAQARQTVTIGASASSLAIVPGSVLVINSGLPDQENVIVESVSGSTFTAVFLKAHTSSATVTGKRSYTLAPSVGSRRCVSLSGITYTLTAQNAGAMRVVGVQDRVGV